MVLLKTPPQIKKISPQFEAPPLLSHLKHSHLKDRQMTPPQPSRSESPMEYVILNVFLMSLAFLYGCFTFIYFSILFILLIQRNCCAYKVYSGVHYDFYLFVYPFSFLSMYSNWKECFKTIVNAECLKLISERHPTLCVYPFRYKFNKKHRCSSKNLCLAWEYRTQSTETEEGLNVFAYMYLCVCDFCTYGRHRNSRYKWL